MSNNTTRAANHNKRNSKRFKTSPIISAPDNSTTESIAAKADVCQYGSDRNTDNDIDIGRVIVATAEPTTAAVATLATANGIPFPFVAGVTEPVSATPSTASATGASTLTPVISGFHPFGTPSFLSLSAASGFRADDYPPRTAASDPMPPRHLPLLPMPSQQPVMTYTMAPLSLPPNVTSHITSTTSSPSQWNHTRAVSGATTNGAGDTDFSPSSSPSTGEDNDDEIIEDVVPEGAASSIINSALEESDAESGEKRRRSSRRAPGHGNWRCPHPNCGKRYSLQRNLESHKRLHTGQGLSICRVPQCGKMFIFPVFLRKHLDSHTISEREEHARVAASNHDDTTARVPRAPPVRVRKSKAVNVASAVSAEDSSSSSSSNPSLSLSNRNCGASHAPTIPPQIRARRRAAQSSLAALIKRAAAERATSTDDSDESSHSDSSSLGTSNSDNNNQNKNKNEKTRSTALDGKETGIVDPATGESVHLSATELPVSIALSPVRTAAATEYLELPTGTSLPRRAPTSAVPSSTTSATAASTLTLSPGRSSSQSGTPVSNAARRMGSRFNVSPTSVKLVVPSSLIIPPKSPASKLHFQFGLPKRVRELKSQHHPSSTVKSEPPPSPPQLSSAAMPASLSSIAVGSYGIPNVEDSLKFENEPICADIHEALIRNSIYVKTETTDTHNNHAMPIAPLPNASQTEASESGSTKAFELVDSSATRLSALQHVPPAPLCTQSPPPLESGFGTSQTTKDTELFPLQFSSPEMGNLVSPTFAQLNSAIAAAAEEAEATTATQALLSPVLASPWSAHGSYLTPSLFQFPNVQPAHSLTTSTQSANVSASSIPAHPVCAGTATVPTDSCIN